MEYHISCRNPLNHYLDIRLVINNCVGPRLNLQLPAWRPGRYELANYAKNLRAVQAFGSQNNPLKVVKTHKDRWQVTTGDAQRVTVTYQYYAYQMDAGGSLVDDQQWYLNFINCLLYTQDRLTESCRVYLDLPQSYRIATGLKAVKNQYWEADDYYQLVDSPLIATKNLRHWSYTVRKVRFHLWFVGSHKLSKSSTLKAFKAFSSLQIETLGEFPENDYHFLYQIPVGRFYHGVEHANSTVIVIGPGSELHKDRYSDFLGVSSHELFHAWNVIKIRPKKLLPYNFSREVYFEEGFVAEGFTTYYGDLFLVRSGVYDTPQYFKEINTLLKRHFENNGRHIASLTESSEDLWVDGYQSAAPARKVSIYTKGALVALILDLTIRELTDHESSLDQVVRELWQEFGKKNRGYQTKDVQRICKKVSGFDFDILFDDLVRGTAPLEPYLESVLEKVGCRLQKLAAKPLLKRCFGMRTSWQDGKLKVLQTAPDSPAAMKISRDDLILRINGKRVRKNYRKALGKSAVIKLQISRRGRKLSLKLSKSKQHYFPQFRLKKLENASESQRQNFQKWMGQKF